MPLGKSMLTLGIFGILCVNEVIQCQRNNQFRAEIRLGEYFGRVPQSPAKAGRSAV